MTPSPSHPTPRVGLATNDNFFSEPDIHGSEYLVSGAWSINCVYCHGQDRPQWISGCEFERVGVIGRYIVDRILYISDIGTEISASFQV